MAQPETFNPGAEEANAEEDSRTLKSLGKFIGGFALFTLVLALAVTFFGPTP
ncbi:MAG: hypothetical protein AAGI24_08075 [Pseudomonadota bacterium]